MVQCIDNPGHFWPTAVIERLIPIQRSYNAVKNRKHELLNRKAIGVLSVEDDGVMDTEDLEQEGLYPGKILTRSRGAQKPEFLENKDSATDFDAEEKSLIELFQIISGVSPFSSYSMPPAGVESGIAMEKIREADDTRLSLTADNINKAAIQGWKIDLRMYKQFAKGPRLLRYVGDNEEVDLVEWMASDLNSDDVIIEKEDELAQTPAQRKQMVLNLLQYGLFETDKVDPRTRNKVMEALKLGNWEDTDDIEELHVTRAKRENMFFYQGIPPQIKPYDLHLIHIREHDRLRLDTKYEEFEMQYPEAAYIFNAHVYQHEMAIQANIMQQMKMQAQAQGQNQQQQQSKKATSGQGEGKTA
jgi:hypothetical protein